MSEEKVIKSTKNINTVDTIYNDLLRLGIKEGDVVLVHSSLSSIGWVCGATQAIIMALQKSVGDNGTLIMPTQSEGNSDPRKWTNPPVPDEWIEDIYENMPAFDVNLTPTRGMGQIAEAFRTLPGVYRSNHPKTSFAAWGKDSKYIINDHSLTPQFGMKSPLGKIYKLNGKILLLGVEYDSCTSFHLSETLNDRMEMVRVGAAMLENNKRTWKWFEDFDYDSDRDFKKIGEEFEYNNNVIMGKVGNASCKLFNMKKGVHFAKEWIEKNRFS